MEFSMRSSYFFSVFAAFSLLACADVAPSDVPSEDGAFGANAARLSTDDASPESVRARLLAAQNAHDPEAMGALFADDYASEQPIHPERAFVGNIVAAHWGKIFAGVPDLYAQVLRSVVSGNESWTEEVWTGHNAGDGSDFKWVGVTIIRIENGKITWGHLYMEPVQVPVAPDAPKYTVVDPKVSLSARTQAETQAVFETVDQAIQGSAAFWHAEMPPLASKRVATLALQTQTANRTFTAYLPLGADLDPNQAKAFYVGMSVGGREFFTGPFSLYR
jgi:hypothetical protein